MNWKTLTIEQAQYIYGLTKTLTDEVSLFEVHVKALSYLTGTPEDEINSWGIDKLNDEVAKIQFIYEPIPEVKPKQRFKVNGQNYFVTYDMKQVSYGTYNEVIKFSQGEDGMVNNLHMLMASIVIPTSISGKKIKKDHSKISEDMKQAPFLECHSASVFFYQVYNAFLKVSHDYLEKELMRVMNKEAAKETVLLLQSVMDGYTPQKNLQTL